MAKILGLSQSAYSRLELNETSAEIEQIVNFAKLLHNYSDKKSLHTIESKDEEIAFIKRENQLLQDKIQQLEELLQLYKQQKGN